MMFVCYHVPEWPLRAAEISGVVPPDQPAALVEGTDVSMPNSAARSRGVLAGMSVAAAQTLANNLRIVTRHRDQEQRVFSQFYPLFLSLAPWAAVPEPGVVYFPLDAGQPHELSEPRTGAGRASDEDSALDFVHRTSVVLHDAFGFDLLVGWGEGTFQPWAGAASGQGSIPLEICPLSFLNNPCVSPSVRPAVAEALSILEKLGMTTCADLLHLGHAALIDRFGESGQVIWEQVTGRDLPLPLINAGENSDISILHEYDPPLNNAQAAAFALRPLVDQLWKRTETLHVIPEKLRADITVRSHGRMHSLSRTWQVAASTRQSLVDRLRWQIESWERTYAEPSRDAEDGELDGAAADEGIAAIHIAFLDLVPEGTYPRALFGAGSPQGKHALLREHLASVVGHAGIRALDDANDHKNDPDLDCDDSDFPLVTVYSPPRRCALTLDCGHDAYVSDYGTLVCRAGDTPVSPVQLRDGEGNFSISDYAGPWIEHQHWWDQDKQSPVFHSSASRGYLQVFCVSPQLLLLILLTDGGCYEVGSYLR